MHTYVWKWAIQERATFFCVRSEGKPTLTEQVSRELFSAVCLDFRTRLMKLSCVPFHQLDQPLLVRKEEKLAIKESEKKSALLSAIVRKREEKI